MTMPDERANALRKTYDFLRALLDPKQTPKVPKAIRLEAYRCIKHYPGNYYIDELQKGLPDLFGKREKAKIKGK